MALTKVSRGLLNTSIVDNGNATAITIDSSEDVTFSGTVTATDLTLSDATNPTLTITDTTNTTTLFLNAANLSTTVGTSTDHPLKFDTNDTERLRIGPAGQIGLSGENYGTSGQVLTSNGGSSAPTWQDASGGGGNIDGTTINPSAVQVGGTTVIDSSRDLAVSTASIGGATNSFALNVYHPTTNVVARFESGDGNVWIDLHDSDSGTYGALLGHDSTNLFKVADSSAANKLTLSNAGLLDTDAGYSVGGTTVINSSRNLVNVNSVEIGDKVTLSESTDRGDLLEITGTTSGWAGLQIRNSSSEGRWSFMTDGTMAGIYDDENADWYLQFNELGATEIFHNSVQKLTTTTGGVTVTGDVGTSTVTASGLVTADRFYSGLGTAASPAFQVGDTNTGLYDSGANTIGVACNGGHEFDFGASRLDMHQNRLDNVSEIKIVDGNTKLSEGDGNAVRITTNSGYVDIGPMNTTWVHFQTDRGKFYFEKVVHFDGQIYNYVSGNSSDPYWRAGNDGSGSGLDADSVDGIHANGFLRSDATDYITGTLLARADIRNEDAYRDHGVYGDYDSYKTNHIWSMGSSYRNSSSGANFGNLYGAAYTYNNRVYTSNAMGGGHQMVWCSNGVPKSAMGNGLWTSGNVTAYSDIRVKTNLEIIPNALEKVQKLNGYTFDRTDVTLDQEGNPTIPIRQTGVVAQEVLEVLPEAVTGDEDSHYNVAYGNMVGLLIEAIKELKSEVDDLKQQLEKKK